MRDRFLQQEVWDRMGVTPRRRPMVEQAAPAERRSFQQLLFSKIVPNCKKLGLLDAGDGWLRKRFGEIGVIQPAKEPASPTSASRRAGSGRLRMPLRRPPTNAAAMATRPSTTANTLSPTSPDTNARWCPPGCHDLDEPPRGDP